MTTEMQNYLAKEIAEAEEANDHARMERIMARAMLALIDCQRKTAERVKELCAEREAKKNRIVGATLLWNALKLVATAGGGALVLRLFHAG